MHWKERESYRQGNETKHRTVVYESHEQYINSQTVLFGTIGGSTIEFPAGVHTYTFACVLPDRLPGSVKGQYGAITYKVKLTVDIPWGLDEKEKVFFSVVNVVDLNRDYSLRMPLEMEKVKSFCLCSCGPDEAIITIRVPKGGYTSHETISVAFRIDNKTTVDFVACVIKLTQIVTFKSTSPRSREKEETKTIVKETVRLSEMSTREKVTEGIGELKLPVCPVSCHFAFNIRTHYVLKITFPLVGLHCSPNIEFPIEIGTIPISVEPFAGGVTVPLAETFASVPLLPMLDHPSAPTEDPRDKTDREYCLSCQFS